jgi:DnaJ-domain-containing protein 1
MMLTKDYIIETIDLEIEALEKQREALKAAYAEFQKQSEEISDRMKVLEKLIKEMGNDAS